MSNKPTTPNGGRNDELKVEQIPDEEWERKYKEFFELDKYPKQKVKFVLSISPFTKKDKDRALKIEVKDYISDGIDYAKFIAKNASKRTDQRPKADTSRKGSPAKAQKRRREPRDTGREEQ